MTEISKKKERFVTNLAQMIVADLTSYSKKKLDAVEWRQGTIVRVDWTF